ncbi:MAG: TerC family protein [Bacteroidetes bacterium]|jgi:predicted tellurium resistance membrane protein TerC|nr:TerC family protein [Bacteroidota bacterium]
MELEIILSILTLVLLEAVLGIDNVIFISILASKLPANQQRKARRIGLILAGVLRLALLGIISLIMQLQDPLIKLFNKGFNGKDLILIAGGIFLLYKSVAEIYHKTEGESGDVSSKLKKADFVSIVVQILIMDLVFSIDSIITAIGMVKDLWVMYVAVILSVAMMLFAAGPISNFVNKHPAFKMLALAFLMLIGFSLVAEGWGLEIPKGYIYFAMAFSFLVDLLQMRMHRKTSPPAELREHYKQGEENLPKDII